MYIGVLIYEEEDKNVFQAETLESLYVEILNHIRGTFSNLVNVPQSVLFIEESNDPEVLSQNYLDLKCEYDRVYDAEMSLTILMESDLGLEIVV